MLSHHDRCVFIHIPRTAGQSIERVFLDRVGLTWDSRAPLLLRANDRPELGPPWLAHLKARDYVDCRYMTREQFDGYFKFAFVRNPWDRVVSFYRYLGYQDRCDFKRFVSRELVGDVAKRYGYWIGPQADFVGDESGAPLVDFIGRFERLQQDFDRVCSRLGIPPTRLAHVNRSVRARSDRQSYVDYYDEESIERVAQLYRRDLDLLGYRFGEGAPERVVAVGSGGTV